MVLRFLLQVSLGGSQQAALFGQKTGYLKKGMVVKNTLRYGCKFIINETLERKPIKIWKIGLLTTIWLWYLRRDLPIALEEVFSLRVSGYSMVWRDGLRFFRGIHLESGKNDA